MCGQGGCAGSITVPAEKVFYKLLVMNSLRGIDSTGACSVKRDLTKDGDHEVVLAKEIGNPYNLFDVKRKSDIDFSDVMSGQHRALIGHCRASTRGETSRRNAHPFAFDNIIGTHNGTLDYTSHQKLEGYKKFGTDSECIFNEIEELGIAETVKKLEGAWALVWFDAKNNSINFLRNKERPLTIGFDKDRKMLFWSSEKLHLHAAMADIPHEDKYLMDLPENDHYSWVIPPHGQAFGKPLVAKREGYQRPLGYYQSGTGSSPLNLNKRHSHSQTGNTSTDLQSEAFFDPETFFWCKWSVRKVKFVYSAIENGVYYESPQECWDNLQETARVIRLRDNKIPKWVNLGYYFDDNLKVFVKETPEEATKKSARETLVEKVKEGHFRREAKDELGSSIENNFKIKLLYKDSKQKVYWNSITQRFDQWSYDPSKEPFWTKLPLKSCPDFVPFTKLDINANHSFHHTGKKNKKRIEYKGFNGRLLDLKEFNEVMQHGCLECARIPQWGNKVTFLESKDFLCEFCSEVQENIPAWKQVVPVNK